MVHCSSVRAFVQEPLDEPLDETRAKVTSPSHPAYDRSKAAGEAEVRKVIAKGLDAVIVNPTAIIGPCDCGPSRMGRFFLGLYDRTVPTLIEGGCNWVDVRDVLAGILEAEARGRTGENYLLAGHWQSTTDLAALVEQVVGVRPPAFTCPMWLARAVAPVSMVYARMVGREVLFTTESLYALRANRHVLHDKATRELGYQPRPTLETVRDLYQWFASAGRPEPDRQLARGTMRNRVAGKPTCGRLGRGRAIALDDRSREASRKPFGERRGEVPVSHRSERLQVSSPEPDSSMPHRDAPLPAEPIEYRRFVHAHGVRKGRLQHRPVDQLPRLLAGDARQKSLQIGLVAESRGGLGVRHVEQS
jgi:hypothetical protein